MFDSTVQSASIRYPAHDCVHSKWNRKSRLSLYDRIRCGASNRESADATAREVVDNFGKYLGAFGFHCDVLQRDD